MVLITKIISEKRTIVKRYLIIFRIGGGGIMKKHGIRLFAEITAAGILALTAAYFAVRYYMVSEEYADSRRGTLSRSYETLVSLLISYRSGSDAAYAEKISFCTAFLPVSERSELAVGKFCADISASETDRGAGERAERYCGKLLVTLSCSRTAALSGEMPEFPEETAVPSSALPDKYDDGGRSDAETAANELLGHPGRLRGYTYRSDGVTVFGFRTASSYAEYSSGTGLLIRAVIYRTSGSYTVPDRGEALAAARKFSAESGYLSSGEETEESGGGIFVLSFPCGGNTVTVGVNGAGEVCLFSAVPE